jgi:hypothetical protein
MFIWEILALVLFSILGGIGLVYFQAWLFGSGTIPLDLPNIDSGSVSPLQRWIEESYILGAWVVTGTAIALAIAWFLFAITRTLGGDAKISKVRASARQWWIFFALNIVSLAVSFIFFRGQSNAAIPWLVGMYALDIFWCFVVATAFATPGQMRDSIPNAWIRNLIFRASGR